MSIKKFPPWSGLPIALICVLIAWSINHHEKSFAATGAVIAVLGVLTIGRPIIRMGYGRWFSASQMIDGGTFPPTREQEEEDFQQREDARAIQIYGPLLIVVGTLMNGFSGYIC